MKLSLSIATFLLFFANLGVSQSKCDIVEIYERITPTSQDKNNVVLADGVLIEEFTLMKPVRSFNSPKELKVSKESRDIYVTPNKQYYIHTKFCHQYAKFKPVKVTYKKNGVTNKGRVEF